jgi:hypothetical protein
MNIFCHPDLDQNHAEAIVNVIQALIVTEIIPHRYYAKMKIENQFVIGLRTTYHNDIYLML